MINEHIFFLNVYIDLLNVSYGVIPLKFIIVFSGTASEFFLPRETRQYCFCRWQWSISANTIRRVATTGTPQTCKQKKSGARGTLYVLLSWKTENMKYDSSTICLLRCYNYIYVHTYAYIPHFLPIFIALVHKLVSLCKLSLAYSLNMNQSKSTDYQWNLTDSNS